MKKIFYLFLFFAAFILAMAFRFITIQRSAKQPDIKSFIAAQKKFVIGCGVIPYDEVPDDIPPLTGWGNYKWKINTRSDSTRFYFNQGINMYFAFHTIESRASFIKAVRFDSTCAMAWYGEALALGPTINFGNGFRASAQAQLAAVNSKKYAAHCTAVEKGLIEAIGQRYSTDTGYDLKTLQSRYTQAMQQLAAAHPKNADVLTLYADALMLEHPWNLYDKDLQPKPWTPLIRQVLEQALLIAPKHPGANHYIVHTLEGSLRPQDALKNAEILATLMPDVAHIVHMPSHIYIRTGYYKKGIESNDSALNGFTKYVKLYAPAAEAAGLYQFHAIHMKVTCAMMAGNYTTAMQGSGDLQKQVSPEYMNIPGAMGSYMQYTNASRLFTMIRFGKWEDILQEPVNDSLAYTSVIGHFGRGMALGHLKRFSEATAELKLLQKAMQATVLKEPNDPNSAAYDACLVAESILTGVLAAMQQQNTAAISAFQKAVDAEDNIIYNEPRDWLLPARQYLGDILLKTGALNPAIKVFNRDLQINPHNGWSLTGLQIAYRALHDKKSLARVNAQFANAWQIKDVEVKRPVF